eukprot:scaffold3957_cov157-Pinguiococcus_pyrenoidosus.AAC.1
MEAAPLSSAPHHVKGNSTAMDTSSKYQSMKRQSTKRQTADVMEVMAKLNTPELQMKADELATSAFHSTFAAEKLMAHLKRVHLDLDTINNFNFRQSEEDLEMQNAMKRSAALVKALQMNDLRTRHGSSGIRLVAVVVVAFCLALVFAGMIFQNVVLIIAAPVLFSFTFPFVVCWMSTIQIEAAKSYGQMNLEITIFRLMMGQVPEQAQEDRSDVENGDDAADWDSDAKRLLQISSVQYV